MSANKIDAADMMLFCANCGKAEVDEIKLKDCDKCDLARYCSDKCQKDHRPEHRVICTLRAAELRDEILFKQPESSCLGDCPICFLPLPLDESKSTTYSCCGKIICKGCSFAHNIREFEQRLKHKCQFCRKPDPKSSEEAFKRLMKRAEANDPVALRHVGWLHAKEGDYDSAFEYYKRATDLGYAEAHFALSFMYREGEGVEKDKEMEIYHLEEAAIAGHPVARYNLGLYEGRKGRIGRAVKHWIIAANLGDDKSIQILKANYRDGHVIKDDLAAAFRAHQAAVDATKSSQREAAEKYFEMRKAASR